MKTKSMLKNVIMVLLASVLMLILNPLNVLAQGQIIKRKATSKSRVERRVTHGNKNQNANKRMSETERQRVINNLINNMVYVQGGTFIMGATSEQGSSVEDNEKPTHKVILSDFKIGTYEVSQREWIAIMNYNPSGIIGYNRPVENVSWKDCQKFIEKLNYLTGKRFRLPTEAEWEYAARGGSKSRGYLYSGSSTIWTVAWYGDNSNGTSHNIGSKQSNELGLFDMSGNVWEWCQDYFAKYSSSLKTNPIGPSYGETYVVRGGGWYNKEGMCRISYRRNEGANFKGSYLGFRLAM